jgi:uncharacterized membrane protein YbhN (UPF0104 family)
MDGASDHSSQLVAQTERVLGWLNRLCAGLTWLAGKRWLRVSIQMITLAFCAYYLATNVRNLGSVVWQLHLGRLLGGAGFTLLSSFLGAVGWRLLLGGMGQPRPWVPAMRSHLYANLAKYMPGYAWQLMGKALLTRQLGVPADIIAVAMSFELLETVATGAALSLALVPTALLDHYLHLPWLGQTAHIGGIIILAGLAALPAALARLFRITGRGRLAQAVTPPWLWTATAVMFTGWITLGIGYWLLGAALTPLSIAALPLMCFALTFSTLVGLVVVVVPMGIGVREAVMVAVLGGSLASSTAVIQAGLFRLVVALGELLGLGVIQVLHHRQKHLSSRN